MKDEKIIKRIPLVPTEKNRSNEIEVSVYYSKGGINYFTGKDERRGLYLSVTPQERTPTSVGYIGFSGIKRFVLEMKKFTPKKLESYVPTDEEVDEMVKHVIEKNNLIVKE